MALAKITENDLENVGVLGLPDTPGLSTAEMQAKFEETARQVIIPAFNRLVEALTAAEGISGAAALGAVNAAGRPITVQDHILDRSNPHGVTAAAIGACTETAVRQLIAQAQFASGSADMYRSVYDPQSRACDVFAYVDKALEAAVTGALNGEV